MKKISKFVDRLEEDFIAIILGSMVIVTFTQVVARYGFNAGWGSALEITQVLFAWLTLFGMSYGIKRGFHLGVDILIRRFPKRMFKACAVFGAVACIVYGITLISAEWISLFGFESGKGEPGNIGSYFMMQVLVWRQYLYLSSYMVPMSDCRVGLPILCCLWV